MFEQTDARAAQFDDRASDCMRIEREHRVVLALVDGLQAAVRRRTADRQEIEQRKAEFLARLDEHMACEQAIMEASAFPLTFTHLEAHQALHDQIATILSSIESDIINKENVGKLLKKVYEHHVKYHDDILKLYLSDKYSLAAVDEGLGI